MSNEYTVQFVSKSEFYASCDKEAADEMLKKNPHLTLAEVVYELGGNSIEDAGSMPVFETGSLELVSQ
jgi:hypothetical protein